MIDWNKREYIKWAEFMKIRNQKQEDLRKRQECNKQKLAKKLTPQNKKQENET